MLVLLRSTATLIGLTGLVLLVQGTRLALLGGSPAYLAAAALLLASAWLLARRRPQALLVYALLVAATVGWSLWEVGLAFWALVPRLLVISLFGVALLPLGFGSALPAGPGRRAGLAALCAALLLSAGVTLAGQIRLTQSLAIDEAAFGPGERPPAPGAMTATDWLAWGNSRRGTRYSPATSIDRSNVGRLQEAWVARTGAGGTSKNTPLMIDDRVYSCAGGNIVLALDADTGHELWRHDANVSSEVRGAIPYFTTTCRGVSYYRAPSDYSGECPTRILMGTTDARLLAIDAETGRSCSNFGQGGEIDLRAHMGEVKEQYYFVTSAPAVVRGKAVVGGWVFDNLEVKEPSGALRAFDAVTGAFAWAWDMGRPGVHTEPQGDDIYTRGTPNVWSAMSVDEARGLVFAPLGNETPDYFGAQRLPSSEQYASSVVALDGETGEPRWSFQTVHHDIWDYDVPSQPVLVDLPGTPPVPALVQPTKRGEVFLLNREDGTPLAAVTERAVPQGGVPEDFTSATQPFSELPNPVRDDLVETDMWGVTMFDQLACRIAFRSARYEGNFTPPSTRRTIQYPGDAGGYNWGSVSVDERTHVLYGDILSIPKLTRLVPRAEVDPARVYGAQAGTPYAIDSDLFGSPLQIPCIAPPWGRLVAIDLVTRSLLWSRPIGSAEDLAGVPLTVGTPVFAGTMVTAGDLLFFAGALDRRIRALDSHTGRELWQHALPQTAQATPMTYVSSKTGRQYVLITVPEMNAAGINASADLQGEGGYIIAFALPE